MRDRYHENLRNALIKNGWTITNDPLHLRYGNKDMYVDLGAERLLTAEKGDEKIAVEIKTFGGISEITDLQQALGQYLLYLSVLQRVEPARTLYLAVHDEVFIDIFNEPVAKILIEDYKLRLIVFKPEQEVILTWIH